MWCPLAKYSVATSSSTRLLHDPKGEDLKRYAMRYSISVFFIFFLPTKFGYK